MAHKLYRFNQYTPKDPEYLFHCPACGFDHWFKTTKPKPTWTFDGDMQEPTVTPSILTNANRKCHLFVNRGMIEYCADSEHELAGKTVPMPDWETWEPPPLRK